MCIFYVITLKKLFITAEGLEIINIIISTDGRRGSDVTQMHLQHTKKCLLVSPDQLQTMFSSTGKISIKKNHTLITEHNYAATVMVSMTYQIGSRLCNYSRNYYIQEKQYYEHVLLIRGQSNKKCFT